MTTHPTTLSITSLLVFVTLACGGGPNLSTPSEVTGGGVVPPPGPAPTSTLTEGRDYVILERHRFLDEMGFDRPVEAFSLLVPRGWSREGGVKWGSVGGCRGELVSSYVKIASPDGAIKLDVWPARAFMSSQDQMMSQSLQAGAAAGGCGVQPPFSAADYMGAFASNEMGGATVGNLRENARLGAFLRKLDAQGEATAAQYQTGMHQASTAVIADLTWPDGTQGVAMVAVMNSWKDGTDQFTGQPNGFSSTGIFQRVGLRYPAQRKAEAENLLNILLASERMNPDWAKAKDKFLSELSKAEHATSMKRIQWMGEQAKVAHEGNMARMDSQMRSWENLQTSTQTTQSSGDDAQHTRFVQAIREVEVWSDGTAATEFSAGYGQAWSRGDGTYVLSNTTSFDPNRDLDDRVTWSEMKRVDP